MNLSAIEITDYFLRLHRSLVIETREFKTLRHNDDLCPRFQQQLESILRAVGKFEPIVYDTQGFQDHGADVVIRIRNERRRDYEPPELIGLQIKSFGDFRDKELFRILKAQRDDAIRKITNLAAYYIVLCTDEHDDKAKIRAIEAEFKDAERTLVIEPSYALNFIRMTDRKIEGTVTRLEQADDIVFQRALEVLNLPSPTAPVLALFLATSVCEGIRDISTSMLKNVEAVERLYDTTLANRKAAGKRLAEPVPSIEETLPSLKGQPLVIRRRPTEAEFLRTTQVFYDNFGDALGYDIDVLDGHLLDVDSVSGHMTVKREAILPLVALLADAKVRYGLDGSALFEYGAEALGILDAVS